MKIAVIGTGNIGTGLIRKLTKLGHSVSMTNSRGPESLKDLAAETGAKAMTINDAVKGAELIIITIPEKEILNLPKDLFKGLPDSVIIIDTGNYYPARDGIIEELSNNKGITESEWVAKQIGHPVIKVFNSIISLSLNECGLPAGSAGRIALPIAGDNENHKKIVSELVNSLGFDAVDAGRLSESWRQQPGTVVYCTDRDINGVKAALAAANRESAPVHRDQGLKTMLAHLQSGGGRKALIEKMRAPFQENTSSTA